MKAPVPCLDCKQALMELDINADHQHLECPACGATWCFLCVSRPISKEWLKRQRPVASLN